ncbi:SH3 domain-containing protein [Enterocloster asparagiformis]|uniref:SH3 domain-containing protein n=1 Tax=Enterocloster asparagiformis TaxID=333367 RepID=UPI002A832ACE|nr:SH3 domain-containing protein [Enterocloster asparagiformis]
MADIREQIKRKYGVDIETLNLFSLYKISGPDVTDQELELAFAKKRKSWSQFLNSPREDKAAQARQHLEAADRYEAVLRDPSLRKALYAYYQKSGDGTGDASLDFAREFFGIVGKTRRIRRQEIDFFFEYFPEQRKSRQSILEMLKTEFKVSKLDARGTDGGEDERDEKKKKSALVADQFDRSTLLGIRKCQAYLTKAAAIGTTAIQFPGVSESLYRFLDLENCRDIESLRTLVKAGREKASGLRLDGGQEYTPVLDLYNKLDELLDQNDVFYNFKEFKLLVKFPNLTPYMYEIVEARERTIADLARVAQREYGFRDQYDFLFSYFLTMYSKFGIYDNGIRKMMKDAERKQGRQKFLDKVDRILGREKTEPLPPCFTPLFFLAYLPVYLTFGVFELVKLIVWNLRYIAIPAAVPAALWLARATFGFVGYELPSWSRFSLRELTARLCAGMGMPAALEMAVTLFFIAAVIVLPVILGVCCLWDSATKLRKEFDWKGIERTFWMILNQFKRQFKNRLERRRIFTLTRMLLAVLINVVLFTGVFLYARDLSGNLSWKLRQILWEMKQDSERKTAAKETSATFAETRAETENTEAALPLFEITASAANIRSGPGTGYEVVAQAPQGRQLTGTGNWQQMDSVWYELYLDDSRTTTGWASEKVLKQIQ